MQRREFIAGFGGAAAWSLAVQAQQPAVPVIGFLHDQSPEVNRELVAAFQRGLAEIGYVEGRNVAIEYRWVRGQYDRLPSLVADLVHRQVAAIAVPGTTEPVLAVRRATQTIPIVFAVGIDPVEAGLVASLNRPGGNLTGVSILNAMIMAKRLELLHRLVPTATVIALLFNPTNPRLVKVQTEEAELAARKLGVRLVVLNASSQSDIETAFATLVQQQTGALVVSGNPLFIAAGNQLVALAARYKVPTIYQYRETALIGGLLSYGTSLPDAYRLVGSYTGRILKGEKPADLPVQQATKIELVINLRTAKALGLVVPETLLVSADEVIE
jgi:putative tryptophan/tyrosine transport system substrate-binding protein